jgi:hypothetical protein
MNARFPAERLVITTLAERPDLRGRVFDAEIQSAVPEFMRHDPTGALYYGRLDRHLEFGLVAVDAAEPDRPVARAFSVPFAFRDGRPEREELPARERGQRARNNGGTRPSGAGHLATHAGGDAR